MTFALGSFAKARGREMVVFLRTGVPAGSGRWAGPARFAEIGRAAEAVGSIAERLAAA